MVRYSEDANLFACNGVNKRVTKAPHYETAFAITPSHAETRMLEQEADGVFELLQ